MNTFEAVYGQPPPTVHNYKYVSAVAQLKETSCEWDAQNKI